MNPQIRLGTMSIWLGIAFCVSQQVLSSRYEQVIRLANRRPLGLPLSDSFVADFPECGLQCHADDKCNLFIFDSCNGKCYLYETYNESDMEIMNASQFFMKVYPGQQLHEECRRSTLGWDYTGTNNKTINGITCQQWMEQTPHSHSFSSSMGDQHNYCRNPDKEPDGPWCYTTDPSSRWQYCEVPHCTTPARFCRLTTDGSAYFGSVNVTSGGYTCQRWDNMTTHNHSYTYLPEQENFCRNPYNSETLPWCYTTDSNKTWEYCNIPSCY